MCRAERSRWGTQLAPAIEALIDGDCALANYHFSWFHAHARPGGMDLPR